MDKNKYERAMELTDRRFKLLVGIEKQTAKSMINILQEAYNAKHKRRGRHSKLSVELMLMMALEYWRQYTTFFELAFEYGVAESTAHDIVVWVENTLIKCGLFSLPGKKALLEDGDIEIVLVDVTESPIERPKKNKNSGIQAKRKKHTIKTQIFVNKKTYEIIAIAQAQGSVHDFRLFKESIGNAILGEIKIQADSGYQGINDYHKNSETPQKKSKKHPLTDFEKAENKRIACERILIENINAKLKVFKILANKYRNRRKRHGLRMSLICGIYNFELPKA